MLVSPLFLVLWSLSNQRWSVQGWRVAQIYLLFTCVEHPNTFVLISSWHLYY